MGTRREVWGGKDNIECAPNWRHFCAAAIQCRALNVSPSDWMDAQLEHATDASYPFPSQTYGKTALHRWQHASLREMVPALIQQMLFNMRVYMNRYDITEADVASNTDWTEFYGWFRAIYLDADKLSPRIKTITRSALRSTAIRNALRDARDVDGKLICDLVELERKVR